jgi:hypothetical protein
MKRSRIIALLRIVVVVLVLATPAMALPEAASAGFTWDENVATTDTDATADGWTWDESVATTTDAGTDSQADGWTWDENTATTDADAAPSDAAVTEPAP